MTRRLREWLFVLVLAGAGAACGTVVIEHDVQLTINDPTGRLGPPPWEVAVNAPSPLYSGSVDWALDANGGQASPGAPYSAAFSHTRAVAGLGVPHEQEVEIAIVLPALRDDGWWGGRLQILEDRRVRGHVRFAAWGSLFAEEGSESLPTRGTATPRDEGSWRLELTIEIPAAPGAPPDAHEEPASR